MANPFIEQEILRSRPGSGPSWAPRIPDYEFKVDLIWITFLMSQFTYKPNWHFTVSGSGANPGATIERGTGYVDVYLGGEMFVEDSTRPFRKWDLRQDEPEEMNYHFYRDYHPYHYPRYFLPHNEVSPVALSKVVPFYIETEASFWDWVHEVFIPEMEHHEIDEWFKVKGQTPYNPHNPETAGKRLEGR